MSLELNMLLTFRTTYRVMAADQALAAAGIVRGLTPTPATIKSPCGLSLRARGMDWPNIQKCLAARQLEVEARYGLTDAGGWQAI